MPQLRFEVDFLRLVQSEEEWLEAHREFSVDEITLSSGLALLQGRAQAGKTRLAGHLARRLAEEGRRVFYVPLAESCSAALRHMPTGPWPMCLRVHEARGEHISPQAIERMLDGLEHEPEVLVLDGLERLEPEREVPYSIHSDPLLRENHVIGSLRLLLESRPLKLLLAVQTLAETVAAGRPFPADAGSLTVAATCDWVGNVWRPADEEGLPDSERKRREGRVHFEIAKDRFAPPRLYRLVEGPRGLHHDSDSLAVPLGDWLPPAAPGQRGRVSDLGA